MSKDEVIAKIKTAEKADYDYCKFRYDMFTRSINAGKKNRGVCQKCGSERFLPVLKFEPREIELEGEVVKFKSWRYAVAVCPCMGMVKKTEDMTETEAKAVFG